MTDLTPIRRLLGLALLAALAAGCAEDPQPRTITAFMDDPIGLEATLLRCNSDRQASRTDIECKHAREANKRLAAAKEAERQRQFDEESQRKLDQIRARAEAAEAARRRAEEAARLREEQLYEQQFQPADSANAAAPGAVPTEGAPPSSSDSAASGAASTATETTPPPASEEADLRELREELRLRNEQNKDQQRPR